MTLVRILGLLKTFLPTKKIAAWVLGIIVAAMSVFLGTNAIEVKDVFCKSELPGTEVKGEVSETK